MQQNNSFETFWIENIKYLLQIMGKGERGNTQKRDRRDGVEKDTKLYLGGKFCRNVYHMMVHPGGNAI